MQEVYRVLIVEAEEVQSRRLIHALAEAGRGRFQCVVAASQADALVQLARGEYDVALTNLFVSGEDAYETLACFSSYGCPIVVMAPRITRDLGTILIRQGAHDYFPLDPIPVDHYALARRLEYAVERTRNLKEVKGSRVHDIRSNRNRPDFEHLVEPYSRLIDRQLVERNFDVPRRSDRMMQSIVNELFALRGGPRELVELHTRAQANAIEGQSRSREAATIAECRLLLVHMMGGLVSQYRSALHPVLGPDVEPAAAG